MSIFWIVILALAYVALGAWYFGYHVHKFPGHDEAGRPTDGVAFYASAVWPLCIVGLLGRYLFLKVAALSFRIAEKDFRVNLRGRTDNPLPPVVRVDTGYAPFDQEEEDEDLPEVKVAVVT